MPDELMDLSLSNREIAELVARRVAALDDTPVRRAWRWEANGRRGLTEVMATAPAEHIWRMNIPVPQMRVLKVAADLRGVGPLTYARRAVGTLLVALEGLDPDDDVPFWTNGGILGPRHDAPPVTRKGWGSPVG